MRGEFVLVASREKVKEAVVVVVRMKAATDGRLFRVPNLSRIM